MLVLIGGLITKLKSVTTLQCSYAADAFSNRVTDLVYLMSPV